MIQIENEQTITSANSLQLPNRQHKANRLTAARHLRERSWD